jgi:NTE family protein
MITATVLAGGGARGAYEAGAISVLGPALEARGERPALFVGTSVGAINSAYLAATRHLSATEQAEGLLARWRQVTKDRVISPILRRQIPLTLARYTAHLLSVPQARVPSLLDPSPLERSLRRWMEWRSLHRNVSSGMVRAVALVATEARSGGTVVFVEGRLPERPIHSHVVRYARTRLGSEHVRASAAIPILFPPVPVRSPAEVRGWYVDGGTRLNTPIKPALDLGADRLVVIGTQAIDPQREPARLEDGPPDFGDGALHVLHGALVDPLVEDIRMLGNINVFFSGEDAAAASRYREARGKPRYRQVPYIFVAPSPAGRIGALASEVFERRYAGIKGLRSPDMTVLNRLLGADSAAHGELLSYLFFDPEFIEALIDLGRRDSERWLREPHSEQPSRGRRSCRERSPWQVEPLEAFLPSAPA